MRLFKDAYSQELVFIDCEVVPTTTVINGRVLMKSINSNLYAGWEPITPEKEIYLKAIKKGVEKILAEVYEQNDKKPIGAFMHTLENDEKKITIKLRSIDKKGNAFIDVVTKYKLPQRFEIRGKIE